MLFPVGYALGLLLVLSNSIYNTPGLPNVSFIINFARQTNNPIIIEIYVENILLIYKLSLVN